MEDLPVANYHIPLFLYAPKWLPAREDGQLASQIDLAPTLLGLLNLDYTSTFFGRDLLMLRSLGFLLATISTWAFSTAKPGHSQSAKSYAPA